jgi:hypothetical protein
MLFFSVGALAYWLIYLFLFILSYLYPKFGILMFSAGYF